MPVIAVDQPSKGLKIQGRMVMNPSLSDDFWSTSTCDIDLGAIRTQKSISSIGISESTQSLGQFGGSGSTSVPPEFVNHGLLSWNQSRLWWVDRKKSDNRAKAQEPVLRGNTTYESLLGNSKHFHRPVPLSEMVGFLVNVWEHEGLYD